MIDFIQSLPKAEIHIHPEGAIQPQTVLALARRHGKLDTLPAGNVAGLQRWFTFTDFPHFLQIYIAIQDLLREPDDFALAAFECGADMAAQNIRYREVTVTPYTHTDLLDKGLAVGDILAGLEAGRRRARREYQLLAGEFGYSRTDITRLARNAFAVCGAEPELKTRLLAEFDGWTAANALPTGGNDDSSRYHVQTE
ncbi:MAG: hypothetical protein ACE5G8_05870 [Anaerolineae bacterium]